MPTSLFSRKPTIDILATATFFFAITLKETVFRKDDSNSAANMRFRDKLSDLWPRPLFMICTFKTGDFVHQ